MSKSRRTGSTRAILCAAVVGVIAMWCVPAVSLAGMDVIRSGSHDTHGYFGPRHSLTSVWTTWDLDAHLCVNALNDDNRQWAGSTFCTNSSDTNVGHPYCGCRLRWGWAGAMWNYGWGYSRQYW